MTVECDQCEVDCDGTEACHSATLKGLSLLDCAGSMACEYMTLTCSEDWDCDINCHNSRACQTSTFNCPSTQSCVLHCNGNQACLDVTFQCPAGLAAPNSCYIECSGHNNGCKDLHPSGPVQSICHAPATCGNLNAAGATTASPECPVGSAGTPPICLQCEVWKACSNQATTVSNPPAGSTQCQCSCFSPWAGADCSTCSWGTKVNECDWWDNIAHGPAHSGQQYKYFCVDGSQCNIPGCCAQQGSLTRVCGQDRPFMCAMQDGCTGNYDPTADFCCQQTQAGCDSSGGLRPCASCRGPTASPSAKPTTAPTLGPSITPSRSPTTSAPSFTPTLSPSTAPSKPPTPRPTTTPTVSPLGPSTSPSKSPSSAPSPTPTKAPTAPPSSPPTVRPSQSPIKVPTISPTAPPVLPPSQSPTVAPSVSPSGPPSAAPSVSPFKGPTVSPTAPPTLPPSES
eukprot:Hpha_TRINITY_DN16940_c4_g2::TRINITY_DN16940_c4_g2_i7::g.56564::m.56564